MTTISGSTVARDIRVEHLEFIYSRPDEKAHTKKTTHLVKQRPKTNKTEPQIRIAPLSLSA
jgi:hypothetical protein